ncbi:XRE family transcriptional regulator [Roseofilum reptotaenium CS-1145]|uniref:Transcriptional regulator n=1 Tax=Roseofilum reptotaenium AO1-A TaxID=1925591 RepID=A0A1L9QX87_9CYAN|nr:XRE family transcriptional regulator [Roseofilum reptotaenium]MDB9519269.1 XRE family transcriptional regulator [Roseofilum reptotaenium CS-1145]OJJ27232.1 transcriptional regulator [Roseofilum reptotaenium AO1-A]
MKDYTTLSSELAKLSPERQEWIKARANKIYLEELTFQYLQEKLGLLEEELEQYFTEAHPGKAKLESRECLELNTLQEVVNALGGTLEITIKIPQKEPLVLISE